LERESLILFVFTRAAYTEEATSGNSIQLVIGYGTVCVQLLKIGLCFFFSQFHIVVLGKREKLLGALCGLCLGDQLGSQVFHGFSPFLYRILGIRKVTMGVFVTGSPIKARGFRSRL
jgi:hypothetical protein